MKKIILLAVLVSGTGVLSSAVLLSPKKVEQPQAARFVRVDNGFKKDLANAD
ncbi:hypothetical protein [Mucilaginibacter sp. FT3.2]|uniref:hypothetical protein n=1 Tax=Mucilaginibacter sp. FT3.2 TaxID=2723090 RepID=UPI00161FA829|nr:hypothetical protein [Mucilaginibacter sp. FT3.2]MBB6234837.1 hypothetical protein [Mucilaginibacter sp. FT3.2]